jgi:small GTP-binding protein
MRLAETIDRWMGRVELALAGLEDTRRLGEEALAAGDAMRARGAAHAILARVPGSPHGLALLADACEAGGLDAELELTLEELARRAPSQAEVWLRLGRARQKTRGSVGEIRDAFVRALSVALPGSPERKAALVALADLDLAAGDGARAELWLERLPGNGSRDVALRRAEARMLARDLDGAKRWLDGFEAEPTDGRAALARGRCLAMAGDPAAFTYILRAAILDEPGASELLSSTLAWVRSDEATRARVRAVVEARGEAQLARFRAAFARAEGRPDDARAALKDAVAAGDASAARPLLEASLDELDEDGVRRALEHLEGAEDGTVRDARLLMSAPAEGSAALDALAKVAAPRALPLADRRRDAVLRGWVPKDAPAAWDALLARLDAHARALHDLEASFRLAELSAERTRPVRVAIVGEFNAGKSTFINALIGEEVAPMGVLPTTATLHHLRYAPDPIARVLFDAGHEPPERVVPLGELRAALDTIDVGAVRRVELLSPIPSLTRVELIDTPGFNAPDARHSRAARGVFEEADVILWLLDAAQPLKQSERVILEEVKAAGIPLQILVNKADRLKPEDLARVMAMVSDALSAIGIAPLAAPLALSARRALAGRLGDEAALSASGWTAVSALLDEAIVGRAPVLKERALRRRAAGIVGRLRAVALGEEEREREARARREERQRRLALAAARIERDAEELARELAGKLAHPLAAWVRDLDVVVTARDQRDASADAVLVRYRTERAVAHLAGPLATSLAALVGDELLPESTWAPIARAAVRGAAASADLAGDRLASAATRAALAGCIEELYARSTAMAEAVLPPGPARELGALEAVLVPAAEPLHKEPL